MANFNQICYNFQKDIINIFNQQTNIPFLLKYYLLKDIWDGIEKYKIELDINNQQKEQQNFQDKTLTQFKEEEEPNKQDLTN